MRLFLEVIWAMCWCIFFWGHQVYSFYNCKVTIQVLFHLRRLRRRGGSDERDALLHPPDARPRTPTRDFVPCTSKSSSIGVSKSLGRDFVPCTPTSAHVAFIHTPIL